MLLFIPGNRVDKLSFQLCWAENNKTWNSMFWHVFGVHSRSLGIFILNYCLSKESCFVFINIDYTTGWHWKLSSKKKHCQPRQRQIHCLHYIWFQNNPEQMNICACICIPYIHLFKWGQSESMVNSLWKLFVQPIFFGISLVVKQCHPLPSSITC